MESSGPPPLVPDQLEPDQLEPDELERDQLEPDESVDAARTLATTAHAGQVDKSGAPYIGHPARVAELVRRRAPHRPEAVAAAWLHDVVEDTPVSLDDLRSAGFGQEVLAAVEALTRHPGEPAEDYYARVLADPLALLVKRADLDDNGAPERLARLEPEVRDRLRAKYAHARSLLGTRGTSADGL